MTTSNEHNNAPSVPQGEPVAWLDLSKMSASAMVYATGWKSNDKQSPLYATPAATEQAAPAVPQGWKLVPVEPTPEMIRCAEMWDEGFEGAYARALAATAAPAPAQDEPLGHFRVEPFGWTDCAEDDEGAIALYERPQDVGLTDADLLNWIERQDLEELSMGLVVDADHDGEYFVNGDDCVTYYGPTLREAIDNAIRARKDNT